MAERACAVCRRSFVAKTGSHRYCTPVCRERARALNRPRRARYGYAHRKLRKRVAALVAAGAACCSRCGGTIGTSEPWDLDHADDSDGYLGPSHAACNRATAQPYVDDPVAGIYWGPPSEPGEPPRRWSRPWFPWRPA